MGETRQAPASLEARGVMMPLAEPLGVEGFVAAVNAKARIAGLDDAAYKVLLTKTAPSWLYPVTVGATTIWERWDAWDGKTPQGGMNSLNHYSFGAVGQWMMAYSLGIQRDEPGFRRFILQPEPDPTGQMTWAKGYYDSMYGKISSSWKVENGVLTYETSVPANTSATLYLPAISEKNIDESGKPAGNAKGVKFLKRENGKAVFELESGTYKFVVNK